MAVTTVFLYVMIFVVSLLLIALILIQPSKSGGMGAAFGGIGESVFGGKAGSHLTKTTVILTTVFFVIALVLAAFIGHGLNDSADGKDLRRSLENAEKTAAVAAPVAIPTEKSADK